MMRHEIIGTVGRPTVNLDNSNFPKTISRISAPSIFRKDEIL